jgi:Cys-rich protein (TIGR01571 family)
MLAMRVRDGVAQQNEWSDSTFNCLSQIIPSCLLSTFCPCILLGQIAEAIHFAPCVCIFSTYFVIVILFLVFLIVSSLNALILWSISGLFLLIIRQNVRKYYQLRSELLEDSILSCCCYSCVISQVRFCFQTFISSFFTSSLLLDGTACVSLSFTIRRLQSRNRW